MDVIYDHYFNIIYNWSVKKTNNREDAEDLTNSIFLAIFEYLNKDIEVKKIENLIWKIARNIWCTKAKKYIKEKNNISYDETYEYGYEDITIDKIIYKEIINEIDNYNLSENEIKVFKLYYIKDLSIKEIKEKCSNYIIKTIFIGGGTPSYLETKELEKLLKVIKNLNLSKDIEYSMECNPGTLTKEKLMVMKKSGVNRISFGLQSCNNKLLKEIGRIHTFEEFLENYNLARDIGFENINVDLMYGLPNLTVDLWKETLEKVCDLRPDHISAYSLIIEEGTAFYSLYNKNKLNLPSEDDERIMDKLTKDILKERGYHQYEISNYAKEGYECIYNIQIMEEKQSNYALGAGSISKFVYVDEDRIERVENVKNVEQYIDRVDEMIERKRKEIYQNVN